MTWQDEFDDSYEPPPGITALEGVEDLSWHNDVCPSFGRTWQDGETRARRWVEHVQPERNTPRFLVQTLIDNDLVDLIETDDVESAARVLVDAVVRANRAQRSGSVR